MTARKLTDYDLGLYASRAYIAKHGAPRSMEDLKHHTFVWQIDDLLQSDAYRQLRSIVSGARIAFSSNSTVIQNSAVSSAVGIGLLHKFLAITNEDLIPILQDINIRRTYWVIFSSEQQKSTKIRAVLSFLDKVVDLNRHLILSGAG